MNISGLCQLLSLTEQRRHQGCEQLQQSSYKCLGLLAEINHHHKAICWECGMAAETQGNRNLFLPGLWIGSLTNSEKLVTSIIQTIKIWCYALCFAVLIAVPDLECRWEIKMISGFQTVPKRQFSKWLRRTHTASPEISPTEQTWVRSCIRAAVMPETTRGHNDTNASPSLPQSPHIFSLFWRALVTLEVEIFRGKCWGKLQESRPGLCPLSVLFPSTEQFQLVFKELLLLGRWRSAPLLYVLANLFLFAHGRYTWKVNAVFF